MSLKDVLSYLMRNCAIAISGLVLIACSGLYVVRSEQINRLEADHDDLSVRRSRMLKNIRYGAELETDSKQMQALLEAAESRLFRSEDLAANYSHFFQLESATGVKLSGLQQIVKPLPGGKEGAMARKRLERAQYQEVAYEMNITGEYVQVLSFLRHLEGGSAFYQIDGFSAGQKGTGQGEAQTNMRLGLRMLGKKS